MSRCIFIHDAQYGTVVTYRTAGLEAGESLETFRNQFTARPQNPFTLAATVLDYKNHVYRIFFTNANNQTWHVDIKNDNTGCKRINFDGGRVQLIVGCADFFPEQNDPNFATKASNRINFLEHLKAEKDNSNESEKATKAKANEIAENIEKGEN